MNKTLIQDTGAKKKNPFFFQFLWRRRTLKNILQVIYDLVFLLHYPFISSFLHQLIKMMLSKLYNYRSTFSVVFTRLTFVNGSLYPQMVDDLYVQKQKGI